MFIGSVMYLLCGVANCDVALTLASRKIICLTSIFRHTQFRIFKQLSGQIHLNHAMRGVHAATFCVQRHCFNKAAQSHPSMRNTKSSGFTQGTVAQGTHRHISSGTTQTEFRLEPSGLQLESFHARDIYKEAVNSVEPRQMVENVLLYDSAKSVLTVQDKSYQLDRNVYVVGFGKAVLGMARAVEDVLGEHVVQGILSIPRNQRQILQDKDKGWEHCIPLKNCFFDSHSQTLYADMAAHLCYGSTSWSSDRHACDTEWKFWLMICLYVICLYASYAWDKHIFI